MASVVPAAPPLPVVAFPPGARVAQTLDDFKKVDDSKVFPPGAADEIKNITMPAPGLFNFHLRRRGNPKTKLNPKGTEGAWYDGDRDLEFNLGLRDGKYHDKSRAEVAGLFNEVQRMGETWEYGTTFRVAPDFVPSAGYCDIMQPPVYVAWLGLTGIRGDTVTGALYYSTAKKGFWPSEIARSFSFKRGEWVTVVVRVKIDSEDGGARDGEMTMSVNGDKFTGATGVKMSNDSAKNKYKCKWGLYGSATKDVLGQPLKDGTVQHANVWQRRVAEK